MKNLDYLSVTWLIRCAHQKTRRHVLKRDWTKEGVPKSNIAIIWTATFEWSVVGCESKNGHQKDII